MFLISLANILPRLASMTAFLCLVVAHLECPLIFAPCSSRERSARVRSAPHSLRSLRCSLTPHPGAACLHARLTALAQVLAHHVNEVAVHPRVMGQFRVERGREQVPLTDPHDSTGRGAGL